MSNPHPRNYLGTRSILQIEGDPTYWELPGIEPENPNWDHDPVAREVIRPLVGMLLLSPRHIGSFSLLPSEAGNGWAPASVQAYPSLYTPSPTGLRPDSSGYPLIDNDLARLQHRIMDAMKSGTIISVEVGAVGNNGVVVLNGGQLPFVVLGKAQVGL